MAESNAEIKLKASSIELYEAFYAMAFDECGNAQQADKAAKSLTYDLAIQEQLLSAVQSSIS